MGLAESEQPASVSSGRTGCKSFYVADVSSEIGSILFEDIGTYNQVKVLCTQDV